MSSARSEKAPISVTFIVRDREESIVRAIKSVRPFVKEIIVVDTGSIDGTVRAAQTVTDRVKVYTGCNDKVTGLIESFGDARNHALRLARQPWAMWMDSDDELVGGDALARIIEGYQSAKRPIAIHFPYEDGSLRWTRERIVSKPSDFQWSDDVHESLEAIDERGAATVTRVYLDHPVMMHHKEFGPSREEGRNLRILRATLNRKGSLSPRQMFYLGREHADHGHTPEAIEWLHRCAQTTGWNDECAMAHMQLSDLHMQRFDFERSLHHALLAHATQESWGEPLVKIARVFYMRANRVLDRNAEKMESLRKCAYFCKKALEQRHGSRSTPLFIDRSMLRIEVHRYLNFALCALGDFSGAVESIDEALTAKPDESVRIQLEMNRQLCLSRLHPKVSEADRQERETRDTLVPAATDDPAEMSEPSP